MAFLVHRAERADLLASGLADLLAAPLPDPFAREQVLVPTRGVERWLSQRLAHRLGTAADAQPGAQDGVCAGVDLRSPASLVAELTGTRDSDPWSPEAVVWPLLEVIDAGAGEAWCETLSRHLGVGQTGEEHELRQGRRYAVARRLARLFGSYAVQHPTLLADWELGADTDGAGRPIAEDLAWQPELWRRLVAAVGAPTPGQRHRAVLDRLREAPEEFALPPRLSLFGHTRIPVTEVELLEAVAEWRDVHLWLPHPSPVLWQALTGLTGTVVRRDDETYLAARHPLLASLGRDLRELRRLLPEGELAGEIGDRPDTLLGWLQGDIAANRLPEKPRVWEPSDRSISVHACHGPARQVEVLREVLVGLLADDPTLEPRDIMVMCPDIEAYAPLFSAAFGLGDLFPGGHPGQHLRVQLADRALTQTNPLLAVAMQLLDLAGGRAEASRVLDLLALDPVRRRFGFGEEDLERIGRWVHDAGVRWAFDAEHRSAYSLAGLVQNTWQFGLDRILTGAAVAEDAGHWFGTTLPLDDVSGTDIDRAGRLAEFVERLQRGADALVGAHPPEHWVRTLTETIAGLTDVAWGDEWQTGQVQRELSAIGAEAGAATSLRRSDVRALLEERFAGRPTRANFRTGNLTVATLTPMRSVPHRVVALVGLDDGVFPRAGVVDGDDVLGRSPLTGERDPRSEDRQLLLDAIMAATDRLVITYTGASESTGQPRPPAVPLTELLDAIRLTATGTDDEQAGVVRIEPLQAFDPANFATTEPRSFDRAALAGARAARADRTPPAPLADLRLSPPTGDIDLAQLGDLLARPVQHFLRHRLEVALLDEDEAAADAIPVELDNLAQWGVGDRILGDLRAGRLPADALALEWRRGMLPPGRLGWDLAQKVAAQAAPVAELVESLTAGIPVHAVDIDVELGGGRRLLGTVTDVHDHRVVRAGFSRLGAKQELEAWLAVLALECAQPGRGWSAGAVGRGRGGDPSLRVAFGPPVDARERLADLIMLYDSGMSGPLPMPLRTAHAYAVRRTSGANDWTCRKAASDEWNPYRSRFPGENDAAAHRFVWGPNASLDVLQGAPLPGEEWDRETTRLGALAMRLWTPILAAAVHR